MKRITVTLMLFMVAICIMAQEHLSFKGIPIDGSVASFCQKLKAKGFTYSGRDGDVFSFTGDFAGCEATVGVCGMNNGENVYMVVVQYESSDDRIALVNSYNNYKDLYTQKYGEPIKSRESNLSDINSNTSFMYELSQGRIEYMSMWKLSGGIIGLSIDKSSNYEGQVIIVYIDKRNSDAKNQNRLDDI